MSTTSICFWESEKEIWNPKFLKSIYLEKAIGLGTLDWLP